MHYSIRHVTKFVYSRPVSESVMEVHLRPRTEGLQRCLNFNLELSSKTRVYEYHDYLNNAVHHFNIAAEHKHLTITATALVENDAPVDIPASLDASVWGELDLAAQSGEFYFKLAPSQFAKPTEPLKAFARDIGFTRWGDPLTVMRELNSRIFYSFSYLPESTQVDSPIDHALEQRAGVCQDFAHVMIALGRMVGVPCRYVSGYLCPKKGTNDHRSLDGASHAWMEAYFPELGWIGFDPTNNRMAGDRHIRVAIGRDYADVPPTRGVFRGNAESVLSVGVRIAHESVPTDADVQFATITRAVVPQDQNQAWTSDQ